MKHLNHQTHRKPSFLTNITRSTVSKSLAVFSLFAVAGFVGIHFSHATTYGVSEEAENGVLAGSAVAVADAAASNIQDIKFGGTSPSATPRIMLITMENRSYKDIIGSSQAPYITSLAKNYQSLTQAYGLGHYSLDNYLGLVSGKYYPWSENDCNPGPGCQSSDPTVAEQLDTKGVSWANYTEDMPGPCSMSAPQTENIPPFLWFPNVVTKDCNKMLPATNMIGDLNATSAPNFVILVPNLCNSMSNDLPCGTIATGDSYISKEIPAIQATNWYKNGGAVVLTYDEGDRVGQGGTGEFLTGEGNHIPTIIISAATAGKAAYTPYVNLFGVLAGVEKTYSLPCLGQACTASSGLLPLP